MPVWAQVILASAALVTATGVLWTKVIRPLVRLHAAVERMYPPVVKLVEVFGDDTSVFRVLDEIAAQFRTDSGSSLRDVVNGLTAAAADNKAAVDELRIQAEASRQLAADERRAVQELLVIMGDLTTRVQLGETVVAKIEEAAEKLVRRLNGSQEQA